GGGGSRHRLGADGHHRFADGHRQPLDSPLQPGHHDAHAAVSDDDHGRHFRAARHRGGHGADHHPPVAAALLRRSLPVRPGPGFAEGPPRPVLPSVLAETDVPQPRHRPPQPEADGRTFELGTGGIVAMKRAACLLLVSAVLLTGCWDRTEVNDLAIVQCSAYDKDGDHYRVSVSFPLVSQMTGTRGGGGGTGGKEGQNNYVESADAEAIRTALANLQRKLSRRLYFAHRRVLLIGEEMARHGVSAILDNIARFPENRISTFVLVAEGSALQLMQTPVLMERIPAEMFREILTTFMKSPVTAKDFIHAILTEGIDPYTLAFDRTETKTGDKAADTIAVHGLAVFRDDRLMGILDAKHLNGALLALDQLRRP